MELDGRPDGKRPHRSATELEYQTKKLATHHKRTGSDSGFSITPQECAALREESAMFYHRYLSLFVLEQYDAVIRDTQHNIDVLNLCGRYGKSDYDRRCLEQYRPYILMMNIRAKACDALRAGFVQTSVAYLRGGIRQIAKLVPREDRKRFLRESNEDSASCLTCCGKSGPSFPADPREVLKKRLREALRSEKYEEAASLRDQLTILMKSMVEPKSPASRQPDNTQPAGGMPPEMPKAAAPKPKKTRARRSKKDSE